MVIPIRPESHHTRAWDWNLWEVNLCGRTNWDTLSKDEVIKKQGNSDSKGEVESPFTEKSHMRSERTNETKISALVPGRW